MSYIDVDKFAEKICNFQAIDENAANAMIWLLRTFPAADVVEVVRCKNCRYCEEAHYEEEGEKPYVKLKCKWSNYSHQPNDYCSCGERREGK